MTKNGFHGWIGADALGGEAAGILARMVNAEVPSPDQMTVFTDKVALISFGADSSIFRTPELIVAVAGRASHTNATDTATVARRIHSAYLARGQDVLSELRGSFSLALFDLREESVLLAVDRMGIAPMYYVVDGPSLIFGTDGHRLTGHPLASAELDDQSIFDYLYFHCVPSPRSIFLGQHKLLPGQFVRFEHGRLKKDFYWQLNYEASDRSFVSLRGEFRTLLEQAVQRAVDGAEVGTFLSGGTDSSTVVGYLRRVTGRPPPAYSIGFDTEGYDELEYSRITVRYYGAIAHEYSVTPQDVVDAIPQIASAYDEPFGNASAVPTYYCARMAAEDGLEILLAGDGGDELFGGNARYAHQLMLEQYHRIPVLVRKRVVEPILHAAPRIPMIPGMNKVRSYVGQANIPLPDRLEAYNFLERTANEHILEPEFLNSIDLQEPISNLREAYTRTQSNSPLDRMTNLDLKITLADNDLRKVTRMCELAGVEARFPLLDEDLVEFSGRIPANLKIRRFQLRYFFKKALHDFLPPEVLNKSKKGFGLPFGVWLKEHRALRELAFDSLSAFKQRNYVKADYIDSLIRQHEHEHAAYYGVMIWVLMMLEQWLHAHKI